MEEKIDPEVALLTNLLFSDGGRRHYAEKLPYSEVDWNSLIRLAERNRVLFRFLRTFSATSHPKIGVSQRSLIREKMCECDQKIKKAIELVGMVQRALQAHDVGFVVFKTLDDYPDIAEDIDVLITRRDVGRVEEALFDLEIEPSLYKEGQFLGESREKRHFYFNLKDFQFDVELYPKFTNFGEEYIHEPDVIKRSRLSSVGGLMVRVPSPEDTLLITCVHSMYRHGGLIRLSDVYNVMGILKNERLDWRYIINVSYESGIMVGLLYFLAIVDDFNFKFYGGSLLPRYLANCVRRYPRFRPLSARTSGRIPLIALLSIFAYKFLFDVRKLRLRGALRTLKSCMVKTSGSALHSTLLAMRKYDSLKRWGWY